MSSQNIIQREELALAHGLERLRMSNSVLGLHIEDAAFDNKDIEAYLKRSIGENIALDEEIENKLKAAVYLSIRRSKWKPRAVAKHMAEVSAHALRDARLAYLYDTDMIAAGQYKTECEKNLVTNTVNAFKRLKARKNRASVKALLATGLALTVGGPYAFMAGAILFATELIPPPMRKKIQQNTQRILKKAGETIASSTKNLYDRGKKVANVVAEKLVSITENVVSQSASYAQPIIETVKKTTANVVETVKEVGRKVKDKAKKAWAWLTGR